jgi:predicted nucleic acid-binding protein
VNSIAYWDASWLLKLYAPEADSGAFRAHVLDGATVVTAEIARLELFAALRRKESAGDLRSGGAKLALAAYDVDVTWGLISVRQLGRATVERFEAIIDPCNSASPIVPVRTLDAIHLASAVVAAEPELVATDKRLRAAALQLGFVVFPPS